MEAALSIGAGEEDTLMAVVEPRQASVPDRLLIALLHAGVAPEALQQRYGVSVDELQGGGMRLSRRRRCEGGGNP